MPRHWLTALVVSLLAVLAGQAFAQPPIAAHGVTVTATSPSAGSAQAVSRPGQPRTFGTSDEIARTYDAFDFVGGEIQGTVLLQPTTGRSDRRTSGTVGVYLPSGATMLRVEVEGCDTSATGELKLGFFRINTPNGTGAESLLSGVPAFWTTGTANTPGCQTFSADVTAASSVIDNVAYHYFILLELDPQMTTDVTFSSLRVWYRLQVSPAPATATFGDVPPSHPFFQFIEALVASGITAGCSAAPPLYCPDAPLTRGQMAVFLSKALGLHFAP